MLGRFVRGGGQLFDIEFLVDENGRRVAAFGYWAGFAGAAVAVKTWCGQQLGRDPVVPPLERLRQPRCPGRRTWARVG